MDHQRNLFGLLPVLALTASFGAAWLWRARPQMLWPNAIAAGAGLFLILAGSGLLKDAQARIASISAGTTGARALPARLAAMRGAVPDKVALFYPQWDSRDYRSTRRACRPTDAAHVLVTFPLFRFFERGAHALSLWPYERVQTGDVFASHEYHAPPDDPRWVLVARLPPNRVWLRVAGLRQVTTRPSQSSTATTRRVLYEVEPGDIGSSGLVGWQATIAAAAGEGRAVVEAAGGLVVDPSLTSTVCESAREGLAYRCSGVVAIDVAARAGYRAGQLAVGVETDAQPADVTLMVALAIPGRAEPRR